MNIALLASSRAKRLLWLIELVLGVAACHKFCQVRLKASEFADADHQRTQQILDPCRRLRLLCILCTAASNVTQLLWLKGHISNN